MLLRIAPSPSTSNRHNLFLVDGDGIVEVNGGRRKHSTGVKSEAYKEGRGSFSAPVGVCLSNKQRLGH